MVTKISACVFDAYGTLFDVSAAAARTFEGLGTIAGPLAALWRERQLQYSWLRALQGLYVPFWQVTAEALDYALEALALPQDAALHARLMAHYRVLDAFPEVPDILNGLRANGFRTAILSNGSPDMLDTAVAAACIGPLLDAVISVDEVATFKPDRRVYQLALDRLGVAAEQTLFVSSNAWDAHAASAFGLRVVWCNRGNLPRERLPGQPDKEISSLRELPGLFAPDGSLFLGTQETQA